MDPEFYRRASAWASLLTASLSVVGILFLALTALPAGILSATQLPRPYALAALDPISRILWFVALALLARYFAAHARSLASGSPDRRRLRLPWEPKL